MGRTKTLYEEQQPTQSWVMTVAWLAASFAALVILAALAVPGVHSLLRIIVAMPFALALLSVWNFRRLHIRATAEGITFGFGIFRRHVPWRDVVQVSTQPYLFLRFLGWGIRLDLRGTIGFIARSSMGVQLETRRLKYFISTNHPAAICELAQRCISASHRPAR